LKDIEKLISKSIPVVKDHPYPMTGASAPDSRQAARHQQFPRKSFRHSTSGSSERQEQQVVSILILMAAALPHADAIRKL